MADTTSHIHILTQKIFSKPSICEPLFYNIRIPSITATIPLALTCYFRQFIHSIKYFARIILKYWMFWSKWDCITMPTQCTAQSLLSSICSVLRQLSEQTLSILLWYLKYHEICTASGVMGSLNFSCNKLGLVIFFINTLSSKAITDTRYEESIWYTMKYVQYHEWWDLKAHLIILVAIINWFNS